MRLKQLVGELQRCETWAKPKVELEQYPTPPEIAAHMLLAAHAEGDLEGRLVADLGCGGAVLGIGAALLGAEHVLAVDVDEAALEVAAQNIEDAEVPVDLLHCDVLQLAARTHTDATSAAPSNPAASAAPASPTARAADMAVVSPPRAAWAELPRSFIESALPSNAEFTASLSLNDVDRAALELEAEQRHEAERREPRGEPTPVHGVGARADALPAAPDANGAGSGSFDCVLMNPPFGTQKHSNGADVAFLRAGLQLCCRGGAVYSLHKTSTRAFVGKHALEWGATDARVVAELQFSIPKMYRHHKKASLDVAVDFWRMAV